MRVESTLFHRIIDYFVPAPFGAKVPVVLMLSTQFFQKDIDSLVIVAISLVVLVLP